MDSTWSDYYFTLGEVLLPLAVIGLAGIAVVWVLWRRWRNRLGAMEQELVDTRTRYDREYFRVLHDHLQSAISHEVVKGLDFISKRSEETLQGLEEEQLTLREKQHSIAAKASEMAQHADNITHLFSLDPDWGSQELLRIRRFTEHVMLEQCLHADSKGVTLVPDLDDPERIALNRDAVLLVLRNVIHNAIRFSSQGGVVRVALYLSADEAGTVDKIYIDVEDSGSGIKEQDHDRIFELNQRADGLLEPGSGLGLYLAREAARSQGGDLMLVRSSLNQGSVFRIIFPYHKGDLEL